MNCVARANNLGVPFALWLCSEDRNRHCEYHQDSLHSFLRFCTFCASSGGFTVSTSAITSSNRTGMCQLPGRRLLAHDG